MNLSGRTVLRVLERTGEVMVLCLRNPALDDEALAVIDERPAIGPLPLLATALADDQRGRKHDVLVHVTGS